MGIILLLLRGEKLNYKVVAMEEFQTSYNKFLNFLNHDDHGRVCSINGFIKFFESQPYMVSHVTRA